MPPTQLVAHACLLYSCTLAPAALPLERGSAAASELCRPPTPPKLAAHHHHSNAHPIHTTHQRRAPTPETCRHLKAQRPPPPRSCIGAVRSSHARRVLVSRSPYVNGAPWGVEYASTRTRACTVHASTTHALFESAHYTHCSPTYFDTFDELSRPPRLPPPTTRPTPAPPSASPLQARTCVPCRLSMRSQPPSHLTCICRGSSTSHRAARARTCTRVRMRSLARVSADADGDRLWWVGRGEGALRWWREESRRWRNGFI